GFEPDVPQSDLRLSDPAVHERGGAARDAVRGQPRLLVRGAGDRRPSVLQLQRHPWHVRGQLGLVHGNDRRPVTPAPLPTPLPAIHTGGARGPELREATRRPDTVWALSWRHAPTTF